MQATLEGISLVESIVNDVKTHVEHLKDLDMINAKVERMTGITNETYKVTQKDSTLKPVIYRRFGESNTNLFLDRTTQKIIYSHVSSQGLGPRIYCYIGQHTRIQQFIQSRVLKSSSMLLPQTIYNVAYTLQKFHSMSDPASIQRKSLIKSIFLERGEELMAICREKMGREIYNEREKELLKVFGEWITGEEIGFLRGAVEPLEKEDGLIFSHNDLLANNILIKNSNNKYVFIDYQYSTYNYAIFDIANYFNQFSFDYDVTQPPYFSLNQYPPNIQQLKRLLIECYCLAEGRSFEEYMQKIGDESEKEKVRVKVERLLGEFALGTMLSNIMWGWWAVIVCKNPHITFDYLEFCKVRYDNYQKVKQSGEWKIPTL